MKNIFNSNIINLQQEIHKLVLKYFNNELINNKELLFRENKSLINELPITDELLKGDDILISQNGQFITENNITNKTEDLIKKNDTRKFIEGVIDKIQGFNMILSIKKEKTMKEQIDYLVKIRKFEELKVKATLGKKYGLSVCFKGGHRKKYECRKDRSLKFDVKENLEGFCGKRGEYLWKEDKIRNLILTLKEQAAKI